jgi:hypothetical protein
VGEAKSVITISISPPSAPEQLETTTHTPLHPKNDPIFAQNCPKPRRQAAHDRKPGGIPPGFSPYATKFRHLRPEKARRAGILAAVRTEKSPKKTAWGT